MSQPRNRHGERVSGMPGSGAGRRRIVLRGCHDRGPHPNRLSRFTCTASSPRVDDPVCSDDGDIRSMADSTREAPLAEPAAVAVSGRSFSADLRAEFARLFRPPRTEVTGLASNAFLVAAAWTLLPTAARDWLFVLEGPMAFAVVLQAWMLGDPATTNVLGNDVDAALDALPDPDRLRRALRAKSVAVGCLVAVPCALVGAVLAAMQHAYVAGALLCA